VERVLEGHFGRILISDAQIAVANDRRAHVVLHFSRLFIANPSVNTSSS
jgi:hypothetical protein